MYFQAHFGLLLKCKLKFRQSEIINNNAADKIRCVDFIILYAEWQLCNPEKFDCMGEKLFIMRSCD